MKFVVATGGSGGHIFPALKVAQEIQRRGFEVFLVGSFSHQTSGGNLAQYKIFDHGASGLNTRRPLAAMISFWRMIKAFFKSWGYLNQIKPDAIIGFGGYGGFPVVLAGVFKGIPTMLHEQNVVPGRANRLLASLTKKVAVSFENSRQYFNPQKIIHTGLPCNVTLNTDKQKSYTRFNLDPKRPTLLVLGGSQGSKRINDVVAEAIKKLSDELSFQVIHCCGKKDVSRLQEKYSSSKVSGVVFDFLKDVHEAYSISDVVVGRAGAGTVMEVAAYGIPTVFIPYPFAGGHQKENAKALQESGLATIIDDEKLSPEILIESVKKMFKLKQEKRGPEKIYISRAQEKIVNSLVELAQ